ncbi:hypothetical protein C8J57DRAFT_1384477 [Mycena rebaudengoi]|nr:hypothetical protein C8J57DRAFT_1384477 [Mycena rebaudengoi]
MSHLWLMGWAQFCIKEAAAAGEITPEHAEAFETLTASLKMMGYSWDVSTASSHPATSLVPMDDSVLSDMFLPPLDPSWMGVFSV